MKYQQIRRTLFWLLLTLALLAVALWCLYFPYNPERVARAIPPNFSYLSRHVRLSERWRDLVTHPIFVIAAEANGVTQEDLQMAVTPDVEKMVAVLAAKDTLLGYVPRLGDTGRPAWVVSSWVGRSGATLGLGFFERMFPDVNRIKRRIGPDILSLRMEEGSPGAYFSTTVVEGVWLACISDHPQAVSCLIDRVLGYAPVVEELRRDIVDVGPAPFRAEDIGWVNWPETGAGSSRSREIQFGLREVGGGQLSGWVRGDYDLLPRPRMSQIKQAETTPGGAPQAALILPAGGVIPQLLRMGFPKTIRSILTRNAELVVPESPCFIGLYGGDSSGRMLGVRVPALICGWRVMDSSKVSALIETILDDLNAAYGWALIPRRMDTTPIEFTTIDMSAPGVYASLKDDEKPCVAVMGDWVLLGSNIKMMRDMLHSDDRTRFAETYGRALEEADRQLYSPRDASAYFSMNIGATAASFREFVAVYRLMLLMQPSEGSSATRAELAELSRWLKRFDGFGDCSAWLGNSGDGMELLFDVDAPGP